MNQFNRYINAAKQASHKKFGNQYEAYFDHQHFQDVSEIGNTPVVFLIDFRTPEFLYLSQNTIDIQGYEHSEIVEIGPYKFYEKIHPGDIVQLADKTMRNINIELTKAGIRMNELIDIKIEYNYRLEQKDGSFRWLQNQFMYLMAGHNYQPLVILGNVRVMDNQQLKDLYAKIYKKNSRGEFDTMYENRFY